MKSDVKDLAGRLGRLRTASKPFDTCSGQASPQGMANTMWALARSGALALPRRYAEVAWDGVRGGFWSPPSKGVMVIPLAAGSVMLARNF